jgi:hypothetical protein
MADLVKKLTPKDAIKFAKNIALEIKEDLAQEAVKAPQKIIKLPTEWICPVCKDPSRMLYCRDRCEPCYKKLRRQERRQESLKKASKNYEEMTINEIAQCKELHVRLQDTLIKYKLHEQHLQRTNTSFLKQTKELELIYEFIHTEAIQSPGIESRLREFLVGNVPKLLPMAPQE